MSARTVYVFQSLDLLQIFHASAITELNLYPFQIPLPTPLSAQLSSSSSPFYIHNPIRFHSHSFLLLDLTNDAVLLSAYPESQRHCFSLPSPVPMALMLSAVLFALLDCI